VSTFILEPLHIVDTGSPKSLVSDPSSLSSVSATEAGHGLDRVGFPAHGAERCGDGTEPTARDARQLPGMLIQSGLQMLQTDANKHSNETLCGKAGGIYV
jgi:hypothetical protein